MKRNEHTTYNQLKKTVTNDTLYVEIPTDWTHEARQAIHELLTIEKGMYASCIGPEVVTGAECVRYTKATEYTANTRSEQENADIDTVSSNLARTEYAWNGYKPTTENTNNDTEEKKEKKNMENTTSEAKKALLAINPHALQGLHYLIGYDFQQTHAIARIQGHFTVNSALKAIGGANHENVVALLVTDHGKSYLNMLKLVTVDHTGKIGIEHNGGYRFDLDNIHMKGIFDDIRKSDRAECFIICQRSEYVKKPQKKPFDTSARYEYIPGKDSKCGDGHGNHWIDRITVRALDGSNTRHEVTKDGNKYRFSTVVYRRPNETRPKSHLEIIDKSGYILPKRRADLLRRADQLRKERAKAAYQATDNAAKVEELRAIVEARKAEFAAAIASATNAEALRTATHKLCFNFIWTMSEFERFADKTARHDYMSIDAAENAYNAIKSELEKEDC